ncbi:hypothetical protein [Cohnella sp. REN36]|uniref:hypothetical protein n=1 Tax=Cohnella sp. REN36 TaxID=2887347 RepID=UPI001D14D639|nr:hypothetical protein [Cohnella sp. REN36]MCC3376062.1 hypothetical protein [Cohnella sp. REN36]
MRQMRRIRLLLLLSVVCLTASGQSVRAQPRDLTAQEAYRIGLAPARKAGLDQLILLTSVDRAVETRDTITLGANGKREVWNLVFGHRGSQRILIVNIKNGGVASARESRDFVRDDEFIQASELVVDSPYLYEQAVKLRLRPGQSFARGYHYIVRREWQTVFFTVVGYDERQRMKKLHFDARTGKWIGITSRS